MFTMTTGTVFRGMWEITIKLYPHLAVIDDDNYIHAILGCKTEEQQNMILNQFLKAKNLPLYVEASAAPAATPNPDDGVDSAPPTNSSLSDVPSEADVKKR